MIARIVALLLGPRERKTAEEYLRRVALRNPGNGRRES